MAISLDRRALIAGGVAPSRRSAWPAARCAQDKPNLRFSAVFSEQDIRAEMMKRFAEAIKDDFTLRALLRRQPVQAGHRTGRACSAATSKWATSPRRTSPTRSRPGRSLTSAYLFRDAAHLKTVFASDVGAELKKMAEDQLGIQILGPTYFGARQVGLKPKKKIKTPADMAGIKLRMPGGDAWQFLGQSLGANPTPMAYAEVYTGLQSGAIDGQDNPLPNVQNMKFYEVIVADRADLASGRLRPALRHRPGLEGDDAGEAGGLPGRRRRGDRLEHDQSISTRRSELVDFFKKQGLEVYAPDVAAFRDFAQKKYLASDLAKSWPAGHARQDQRALSRCGAGRRAGAAFAGEGRAR